MNKLGFQSHLNAESYMYEDDSLNNIAAIVFVVFLFNRCKNKKGVWASPAALLLLLILILLRYGTNNRLSANNVTYNIELEKDDSDMNIIDKNLKGDTPYLGGYEEEDGNKLSSSIKLGTSIENSSVYLGGYEENIEGKSSGCHNKSYVIESSSKYVESYEEYYDIKQPNKLNETYIKSTERDYSGSYENSDIVENTSYCEGNYSEIIGNSSESDSVERYIF